MKIPDGYKFIRCDQYSSEEFLEMFTRDGYTSPKALKYVEEHPKDIYNTDDEIAIRSGFHSCLRMRSIHPLGHGCGFSKRYTYTDDLKWR